MVAGIIYIPAEARALPHEGGIGLNGHHFCSCFCVLLMELEQQILLVHLDMAFEFQQTHHSI